MRANDIIDSHREPSAADASRDREDVEMANLPERDTGVPGIIYISSAQGSHGPRVKWYPARPRRQAPCLTVTVASEPDAINNNLPIKVAESAVEDVKAWVTLNRADLLEFWANGESWTVDELYGFTKSLKKVTAK